MQAVHGIIGMQSGLRCLFQMRTRASGTTECGARLASFVFATEKVGGRGVRGLKEDGEGSLR